MLDDKRLAIFVSHPIHYIIGLAKEIQKKHIDTAIYFYSDFGIRAGKDTTFGKVVKWYDASILDGLRYKFLTNLSPIRNIGSFFSAINFGVIRSITKDRQRPILVYGWNYFSNWLVFVTCFLFRVPVLMRGESPLNQEILKSSWKLAVKKMILKPLFRRISAFLYIGEENRKFYKYYGVPDEKLFFVPYAVDNDRFMKMAHELKPRRSELRKKLLDITDNRPIILFLGKLIEKKRPMDLLRAYELLITNNQLPIIPSLVFVGDGAFRPYLETYVKEHDLSGVHFAGFKNQTEIPEYYAMADVFALPSGPGETWGLVVNEAMCFGLPVIVSDMVGCGPDLVKNDENGYVVPLSDADALSGRLSALMADNGKIDRFGRSSLRTIMEYSYAVDVQGIRRALENV